MDLKSNEKCPFKRPKKKKKEPETQGRSTVDKQERRSCNIKAVVGCGEL